MDVMQTEGFKRWLEQRGLSQSSTAARISNVTRVEAHYGDLDKQFAEDRLTGILMQLQYSADDERRNAPNPSQIRIDGNLRNGLATLKLAVGLYRDYREADTTRADPNFDELQDDTGQARLIGLERDLQGALRDHIDQLEPGLEIVDSGIERSVASGFIDITAKAPDDTIVVIELKTGTARRDAIGQILSYMGDIADEESAEVRGILVAGDFDQKARAAARVVNSLALRSYRVEFKFTDAEDSAN